MRRSDGRSIRTAAAVREAHRPLTAMSLCADGERRPGMHPQQRRHGRWKRNILADFGGRNPYWLISESPLMDGNKLIVTPGGRGAGMVALDKTSGKEIWRCVRIE